MSQILFEACCGSAMDAIEAWKGGAKRVELNSDMFHGGLTPTVGELRIVKKYAPDLKVMCMVRPREGGFCYTQIEYETMLEDAKNLLENGADGIVFGFLKEDATVDEQRCKEMLAVIGDHDSVFHRAIDVVPDAMAALDTLIGLGVTRVLTSGQKPTVPEGIFMIKKMIDHAAGRIQVMPGAGITPENAAWVREMTGTTIMHAAMHRTAYDHSCRFNTAIYFGGAVYPPEDRYNVTHAEDIANFVAMAEK